VHPQDQLVLHPVSVVLHRANEEGTTRAILLGLLVAAAVAAWALPPLRQDPAYHAFADRRALGPVANAANVLSNVVFLIVGVLGLRHTMLQATLPARPAWIVAFAGMALVSVGSAWYHRAPGDDTLLWDRLPMTIGFMGLLAAVLAIPFGERIARLALGPAVVIGAGSVIAWRLTGDLRPYVWVQFAPLLLIGTMVALCPMPPPHRRALLSGLVLYGIAKGCEMADARLFTATAGVVERPHAEAPRCRRGVRQAGPLEP
jgi:Ceramidase